MVWAGMVTAGRPDALPLVGVGCAGLVTGPVTGAVVPLSAAPVLLAPVVLVVVGWRWRMRAPSSMRLMEATMMSPSTEMGRR